jgi:hypothetical protein
MNTFIKQVTLALILTLASLSASAGQDVIQKVVKIEVSYMPERVMIMLDANPASCYTGDWIHYEGNAYGSSEPKKAVQAAYVAALTAMHTGKRLLVHTEVGCIATNIHATLQ